MRVLYTDSLPGHWIVEDEAGLLWIVPPNGQERRPYRGHRVGLREAKPGAAAERAMGIDIVSVTEIAQRAGTTPGTVHSWRRRHADFPAPAYELAVGPVWHWASVAEWLAKPRVRTGRPRGT